ncbi:conserved oligomeric Golgi complex subunit 2-like isoform X3 [Mustela erminea]|uniref:conserved oligomeric Golgi complex subunit 2-like isoform X3 n=1 Tax=Mustela erminea TaxID=36723 RepID=UPI0013873FCC|nr:conserved oligomeric Golgi complex subunit 2-like isoform X3 [Mustela erminea]
MGRRDSLLFSRKCWDFNLTNILVELEARFIYITHMYINYTHIFELLETVVPGPSFLVSLFLQHIAGITAMLQQSLGGLLLEGLQTSKVDIIRHCLWTYATIDKTRDEEALVGQVLVKPYMDEVIVEQIVESHPDGLKIMYANKLLEFVPHHCRLLREVTGGAILRKRRLGHRQYRLKDNRLKTEWRTQLSASQGETFEESNPTATLILDFQRPEP